MTEKIDSLKMPNPWLDISKAKDAGTISTRRERPDSPHNFFWTVNHSGQSGFRFSTSSPVRSPENLPNLSEIQVTFLELPDACMLDFTLITSSMRDLFFSMCLDLMDSTVDIEAGKDEEVIKALVTRINKWQQLLKKTRNGLLTAELQLGLWGELLVLRKMFFPNVSKAIAVGAWTGPSGGEQDFSLAGVTLVEVKTRNVASDRKIKINSVDQLDNTSGKLFLVHQKVAPASEGVTLQGMVDKVRSELVGEAEAFGRFERNLLEYGFVNNSEYDNMAYVLSGRNVYLVDGAFPRIQRKQIAEGVSDVQYKIETGICEEFLVDEQILIDRISGNAGS